MSRRSNFFQTNQTLYYPENDARRHLLVAIASRKTHSQANGNNEKIPALIELLHHPYRSTCPELMQLSKDHKLTNLPILNQFAIQPIELAFELCKSMNSATETTPWNIVQILGENYVALCEFAKHHKMRIPSLEETLKSGDTPQNQLALNLFINSLPPELKNKAATERNRHELTI